MHMAVASYLWYWIALPTITICIPMTAILCAAAPDRVPFMADESVLSVPGLGKLDYNLRHYLLYAKKVEEKAKELSGTGDQILHISHHSVSPLWIC